MSSPDVLHCPMRHIGHENISRSRSCWGPSIIVAKSVSQTDPFFLWHPSPSLDLQDHSGTEHPGPAHEHLRVLADEGLLPEARRVVPRDAVSIPE